MKKPNFKQVQNKDQPVYYQFIDNHSDTTVVFLHGLFSSSSIFKYFLKFIHYNVILVELRGVVYSKCEKPFLKSYVEDIRLILENEEIKKQVILVGYSMGCSIANAFAEKYSEIVDKVIMLAPINRTFKEIGRKELIKSLISSLGRNFFKKWREYLRMEKNWPLHRLFRLFNFKLLKDVCRKMVFTRKCKIIIVNGQKSDIYFNDQDPHLKQPNIIYKELAELDHFLFLSKARIKEIAKHLIIYLKPI
ncbi:alpha/beta hydrolase [Candidatus Peregrinibacteria bacterium]|nr:alpha/beta hydrolase [Candidatus Peregrinibacteria bacterium]